jgi:hypothetical protein
MTAFGASPGEKPGDEALEDPAERNCRDGEEDDEHSEEQVGLRVGDGSIDEFGEYGYGGGMSPALLREHGNEPTGNEEKKAEQYPERDVGEVFWAAHECLQWRKDAELTKWRQWPNAKSD